MDGVFLALANPYINWDSFKQKLDNNPKAGELFEIFCKYYFLVEPSVKDEYKNVWLTKEIPLSVIKKLNIEGKEHGVDLILETIDKKLVAVQCKFRFNEDKNLSWTKDKIANLFGYVNKADKFIIFTNASELDKVSKSRVDDFTYYNISNLLNISQSTFINIFKKANGGKVIQKKLAPRDYQKEAIHKINLYFKNKDRGQMILPCGAGKTLTALWVKESLDSKTTLVLVPSLALLRQTKDVWLSQKNIAFKYLCVCSEDDIDRDSDAPITHTYEIGGRVTTNSDEIRKFLNIKTNKIIFSTYQSLNAISEAIKDNTFVFDLIIADEAHKTAGSIKNNSFTLVHDNAKIPSKKRLYMTATPRITSANLKSRLGDDYEYLVDMSKEEIFGNEAYRMTFKNAIDRKILVDYKIIAIGITNKELPKYIKERKFIAKNTTIDQYANNYAIETVMKKYKASHSLTFHSRVAYAKDFSERHNNLYLNTYSEYVSGKQSTSHRIKTLEAFKKSQNGVISNARCLTEGINVPAIDLVYFCDPKYSKIDIVQASGRALRKNNASNKKLGYIVVPIFHTQEEEIEKAIKTSVFKNLIQVIRALCDQDERLQDEINNIAFSKGEKRLSTISIAYTNQPETIIKLENFELKLKKCLFNEIIEKTKINWNVQYQNLQAFLNLYKRWPNVEEEFPKGNKLGFWCSWQRQEFRKNNLSKLKIKLLNKLDFIWKPRDISWLIQLNNLKNYRQKYPDRWPDATEEFPKGNKLGSWCQFIRQKNKLSELPKDRVGILNKMGFIWFPKQSQWLHQLNNLKNYRQKYPDRWPDENEKYLFSKKLGRWCYKQRALHRKGLLIKFKTDKLNEISFEWNLENATWKNGLTRLISYRKKCPSKWPKQKEKYGEFSLGSWCSSLRQRKARGTLKSEWIIILDNLKFKWEEENPWPTQYNFLLQYRKINPDKWPKAKEEFPKGNKLGSWCDTQRYLYKHNKLKKEQIEKLKKIGFTWNPASNIWPTQYNFLLQYRKINPDKWPKAKEEFPKGNKLGSWCDTQRQNFKKNKRLNSEKIKLLNKINFPWLLQDSKWINKFEYLIEFRKKHQRRWPYATEEFPKGNKLGWWIRDQRNMLKKGRLSNERHMKLLSINFEFKIEKFIPKKYNKT